MFFKSILAASAATLALAGTASAQNYVSVSGGFNLQADSGNSGALTRDFVTGNGVAVPAGTTLSQGTPIAWNTEFGTGGFFSGAIGREVIENVRLEFEIAYSSADVDTHTNVTAGGNSIDAADAAVLITGSAPLGVTVGAAVADGRGDISTLSYAVNGFYDIPLEMFTAYVGAGVGLAEVEVNYAPFGIAIIQDTESVGLFQVMAGASYPLNDTTDLFGGYRFRMAGDAGTNSVLFPTSLDVENNAHVFEFGVRFNF
ncbi:outer membrane protein [Hyphobacterium sp.]|uniref:outer membrane protein n=1 Tax=Hyphobacterium sp. TaxID=2004662 RepID=UPI003BAB0378